MWKTQDANAGIRVKFESLDNTGTLVCWFPMVQEGPTKNANTRRHKLESEMKRPQILGNMCCKQRCARMHLVFYDLWCLDSLYLLSGATRVSCSRPWVEHSGIMLEFGMLCRKYLKLTILIPLKCKGPQELYVERGNSYLFYPFLAACSRGKICHGRTEFANFLTGLQ